jgi:hypothetical protein
LGSQFQRFPSRADWLCSFQAWVRQEHHDGGHSREKLLTSLQPGSRETEGEDEGSGNKVHTSKHAICDSLPAA